MSKQGESDGQGDLFVGGPMSSSSEMGDPVRQAAPEAQTPAPAQAKAEPSAVEILRAESERKDEMIRALLERAPAQGDDRRAPAISAPKHPGKAPDPLRESEKYQKWSDDLAAYQEHLIRSTTANARAETTEAQHRDRLWSTFQQKYGDVSGDIALVAGAFQAELSEVGGRIPSNEDAFLERIATRLRTFRGASAQPASNGAQDTAGVSAGSGDGSPRVVDPARGPKAKDDEKGKPFSDTLLDVRHRRFPDLFGSA